MSNTVDKRIVDMQFNNQQFESGVKESVSSLDKLKKGLDLDASAKSLSGLGKVAKTFSLAGIAEGVDTIAGKFSSLGIIGITVLQNITNSAVNAGKRIAASLTIDPIKQGLSEYETQINAIQTIMANTSTKGTTLDQVNAALAELNTYADKTIYNFTEMTRNIGTFTAAGVDLDTSVQAIKGIANLAAVSGSNSQQASTAMYQLSQALSSGTVKLMDWNSVVNAGMGGQVFQDALKETARVHGVAIDQMITDEGSFRETLQNGWLTSDILTETLSKFTGDLNADQLKTMGYSEDQIKAILELGTMANDAATKVKTLSQLYDTLKEAAQSGWAQSWQIVVGDFDEAKQLFTDISNTMGSIIGASASARNTMLQTWKDLGGRTSLIEAGRNSFEGLLAILKPIKEAFREVFPAMTGERLFAITEGLKNLTAKLKIGDETAAKVKSTFKGLFSILNMGKEAISAIINVVKGLIPFLTSVASGFLSWTASLGDWLSNANDAAVKGDLFNQVFEKLKTVLSDAADSVKTSFDKIVTSFESFTGIDLSSFDTFIETVKTKFQPLTKIGEVINKAFTFIGSLFKKIGPFFSKVGSTIGSAFSSGGFSALLNLFTTGAFAGVIIGIKKLIDSFGKIASSAAGFTEGLTGILNGVKGCLTAYQNDLKANVLLKIAAAIGVLALSLTVMSMLDPSKLTGALTAITVLFTELFGSMSIFDKVAGSSGFKSMDKVSKAMVILSVALLILSKAVATLAALDWDGLAKGLLGVALLTAMMIGTSKLMASSSGDLIKASIGLILFATALRILVSSVVTLGNLDTGVLIKGIVGVIAACSVLALFMMTSSLASMSLSNAVGLLAVAVAVRILASAVKAFGSLDGDTLSAGLWTLTLVLGELALFTKVVGNGQGLISTGIGLMALAVAMIIFAKAIESFGSMPLDTLAKGLVGFSLALTAITIALNFMPKNMISIGLGMLAISAGLILMANALTIMGEMSVGEIAKGIGALAVSLLILVVATNAMTGALAGAFALLVVSAALLGLSVVLRIIGAIPIANIATALIALAGTLTILGVAAAILSPILPAMLLLGASLIVLGVGLAAVGAASLVLSIGLSALSVTGMAGVLVLLAIAAAIVPLTILAPAILVVAAALTVLSIGVFAAGAALSVLGIGLGVVVAVGPSGLAALTAIANTAVKISQFAVQLLVAGAGLLVFGAGALVAGAGALIGGVGIGVLAAGLKVLSKVDLTNMTGFAKLAADLLAASLALLLASPGLLAGGAALAVFGSGAISTGQGLTSINAGIMSVVNSVKAVPDQITSATTAITNGVKQTTDGINAILIAQKSRLTSTINSIITALTVILLAQKPKFTSIISGIMVASISAVNTNRAGFVLSGINCVNGFISGIQSRVTAAANAAAYMASAALKAANRALDINSPSGEFEDVGMYSDKGAAKGLLKYAYLASDAATKVGEGIISPVVSMTDKAFSGANIMGAGFQKMAQKALDTTPVINAEKTVTMRHTFDTLTVEGVNDKNEFVAAADYSVEEILTSLMRRQSRT